MTRLKRLTNEGKVIVQMHADFMDRGGERIDGIDEYLRSDVDGTFDEAGLRSAFERAMDEYDNTSRDERNEMDAELASVVRESIDLSRREATKPGIWWYLTVVEFPDYVRYRWIEGNPHEKFLGIPDEPEDVDAARYDPELSSTGVVKDPYSIALNRLWWAAELTVDPATGDDTSTRRMFFPQRLANYILDSQFRRYPPAARAFADVFHGADTATIDEAADRFKRSLTMYQLEVRTEAALREQLEAIRADVEER